VAGDAKLYNWACAWVFIVDYFQLILYHLNAKVLLNYEFCHRIMYFNQNTFMLCIMESKLRINKRAS